MKVHVPQHVARIWAAITAQEPGIDSAMEWPGVIGPHEVDVIQVKRLMLVMYDMLKYLSRFPTPNNRDMYYRLTGWMEGLAPRVWDEMSEESKPAEILAALHLAGDDIVATRLRLGAEFGVSPEELDRLLPLSDEWDELLS